MKNIVILFSIAAIALLSSCKETSKAPQAQASQTVVAAAGSVVYVQIDSLVHKYDMFNDLKTQFESKWQGVQNDLQSKGKVFENEVNDFQKKLDKGLFTRAEAEERSKVLSNKQTDLQNISAQKQYEMQEEEAVMLNKVMEAIREYIAKYNEDKKYALILTTSFAANTVLAGDPSLDITNDVLEGLNSEYVKTKKSAKADKK